MVYEQREEVLIDGVDDIEKELSLRCFLREEFIWEIALDIIIVSDHIQNFEDAKLFNDWHIDEVDLPNTEDNFIPSKNFLNKVLVIIALLGQIILALHNIRVKIIGLSLTFSVKY